MPVITTQRMTKRRVDAIKPGETIWDSDVRGFCCRARPKRSLFYLKIRVSGRQRWLTIGEVGAPWTVETARREAQRLLGEIRNGADVETLRYGGNATDPTMKDLCARYLDEHARQHKKPSSIRMDERNIENHILPLIGPMDANAITRADIETLKQDIRKGKTAPKTPKKLGYKGGSRVAGGPGVANRCLALLSKMFNLAEIWGWRDEHSNPVRLVAKYPETPSERFLTDDELKRLGEVLAAAEADGSESPYVIAAIRLLLLTGARLGEILPLKWDWVNLGDGFLALPDSKTGRKFIFLPAQAIQILSNLERQPGNPHVIVGASEGRHLINIRKPWGRIRERAELGNLRIHDLRHSFASIAAGAGASLPLIGQLLGHSQPATTQRYAHLAAKPVRQISDQVGDLIGDVLSIVGPAARDHDGQATKSGK